MRRWLASLSGWFRGPVRGGFSELDLQIDKFRMLRDSYQAPPLEQRHVQIAAPKKGGERLCIP